MSAGSDTMDVTKLPVPGAAAAATNETTGGQSNSAFTTGRFQLAPARYVRQYQIGDLLGVAGGPINMQTVLQNLLAGVSLTYTDLITALFPSVSAQVGSTGVNLDVDDIYDGMFTLNLANVPNTAEMPIQVVLHNQQTNDFINSLRAETGAVQFQDATAAMLGAKGPGFRGTWLGLQFWQSDSVEAVTTTVDRSGCMYGRGAFEWTFGPVGAILPHINPGDVLFATPELFVERNRDATNGLMAEVLNLYPAVAIREQNRAVEILSDY